MLTGNQVSASVRARDALASPIRKLTPLADRARADGVRILHLNIGQPDLAAPKALIEGIRSYQSPLLPYAPSSGIAGTVRAWQRYYEQVGLHFETNQLLVTSGGSEALLFALMAIADPGDEVIAFEPTYANYFGFGVMTSVAFQTVPLRPENGYHLPPAEEIEERITPRTRAIVFCSPGNPTGAVFSYEELDTLSRIAERHNLFLVSDETYREIVFEGPRDMSTAKIERTAEQTIVVDSVSKRFSATGARIGCIASRHPGVMHGIHRFAQARLAAPTVEQRAIIPLLENSWQYTEPLAQVYRSRRDVVYAELETIPGVFVRRPEGAFYIFAVLPIDDGERFARWLLTDFRSDGETLMIAPGEGFYLTPGLGTREVRFAYVLEENALRRAMIILREALAVYPGRIEE